MIKVFLILLIASPFCVCAQFVPIRFVIEISALGESLEAVGMDYSFYSCSTNILRFDSNCMVNEFLGSPDFGRNNSRFMYIYSPVDHNFINDTLILRIQKGMENMTLYISLTQNLSEGEVIFLKDIKYNGGNFFFDMTSMKTDNNWDMNSLNSLENEPENSGIRIDFSEYHKISKTEIKKFQSMERNGN